MASGSWERCTSAPVWPPGRQGANRPRSMGLAIPPRTEPQGLAFQSHSPVTAVTIQCEIVPLNRQIRPFGLSCLALSTPAGYLISDQKWETWPVNVDFHQVCKPALL